LKEKFLVKLFFLRKGFWKLFRDRANVDFKLQRPAKHFLVKKNILFVDPAEGAVKPQSKLDLLAIREVMKAL